MAKSYSSGLPAIQLLCLLASLAVAQELSDLEILRGDLDELHMTLQSTDPMRGNPRTGDRNRQFMSQLRAKRLSSSSSLENMKDMLRVFLDVLQKNEIHYWLDYETLLGMTRDNKLVNWDRNLHLSTFIEDSEKIRQRRQSIQDALRREGYVMTQGQDGSLKMFKTVHLEQYEGQDVEHSRGDSKIPIMDCQDCPQVSLAVFEKDKDDEQCLRRVGGSTGDSLPLRYVVATKQVQLDSKYTLNIPSESVGMLEYRFGEDWFGFQPGGERRALTGCEGVDQWLHGGRQMMQRRRAQERRHERAMRHAAEKKRKQKRSKYNLYRVPGSLPPQLPSKGARGVRKEDYIVGQQAVDKLFK